MKIGMIGIGDIAKKAYLPVLTQIQGIELHVCTRREETLVEIASQYKIQHTYCHIEEWLKCGMKAAFVHTATNSHEEIIDQLLDQDIHVYVDKPITLNATSTEKLLKKAKDKGLVLMAGFNRRFAPPYQKLKEVNDPNIIVMQKNRSQLADEPRTVVFDDFIHVIDTILNLFPGRILDLKVRGKQENGLLQHVVLQLEAEQGTAIAIMNREAGTTEEKIEVMSKDETRVVTNVNEVFTHKDKQILQYESNDWEPTLLKRGFYGIVASFLESIENGFYDGYETDLQTHLIAERVVQELLEN